MAHANILNNELVNDDRILLRDLPFAERMASQFSDQIQQLATQRQHVPLGWHRIFDQALLSLKAVNCPKRNGIEISEVAFGQGSIHVEVYYAPVDKVVRGILNCLSKRASSTCQECGRSHGAVYRLKSSQTLCAHCHVHSELRSELDEWLVESNGQSTRRNLPIIEVVSLPINIRLLIPKDKIRCLRPVDDNREIAYVTPGDVMAHLKTLKIMKRYLDQSCIAE